VTAGYHSERGNATIEEMWKEVFSVWSVLRLYNWSPFEFSVGLKKEVLSPKQDAMGRALQS
jgi:hypothetical protein